MKNKNLIFAISLIVAVLAVGIFWLEIRKTTPISVDLVQKQATVENETVSNVQTTEMAWYEVPELGIKFRIPKDMAEDLIYQQDPIYPDIVNISSKELMSAFGRDCDARTGSLGAMSQVFENPTSSKNFIEGRDIPLQNSFIRYASPQSICAPKSASEEDVSNIEIRITQKYVAFFQSKEFLDSIEELSK